MSSSSHQSGHDGRLGPSGSGRNRRSTSDMAPMMKAARKWSLTFFSSNKTSSADANVNALPGNLSSFVDPTVSNHLQQLRKYTSKIRHATKNAHHVDSAWDEYIKHKEDCLEWSKALVNSQPRKGDLAMISPPASSPSPESESDQRDLSINTLSNSAAASDTDASTYGARSRAELPSHTDARDEHCQEAVLEWEATVQHLEETLRTSLRDTYIEYSKDATAEKFERLCNDKGIRRNIIHDMRNASISKTMSADLAFFPKYDVRFRNYDEIKKDLARVRALLGTSVIPQDRTIIERRISPTGDAILEFTNTRSRKHPVFRFRVASHCLRETSSPIFGHMFNARFRAELDDDIRHGLPLPPTRHVCSDGSEVMLYRMPQTELNIERSFEILLHAAHNHSDRVPREVQFNQFVAIAEACQRYRCTAPLELAVELRWLPYWGDQATDDMLEGALLIAYVFGLPENFRRLSRLAISNMTGEGYKLWPRTVQEKIAAVRREKMEEIRELCKTILNEYLCVPIISSSNSNSHDHPRPTRCPRGEVACDVQNLGWFMRWLAEAGLLSPSTGTSSSLPSTFLNIQIPPNQSLFALTHTLCRITSTNPSSPSPSSSSSSSLSSSSCSTACNLASSFRSAINSIYSSIEGLTLFEVSGKRGWALSKNRSPRHSTQQQQQQQQVQQQQQGQGFSFSFGSGSGLGFISGLSLQGVVGSEPLFEITKRERLAPVEYYRYLIRPALSLDEDDESGDGDGGGGGGGGGDGNEDGDDACYFNILRFIHDPRDLRSAALVNRRFYKSYVRNEERLWEGIDPVGIRDVVGDAEDILRPLGGDDGVISLDTNNGPCSTEETYLVENKRLLDCEGIKYAGDAREQLLGFNRR